MRIILLSILLSFSIVGCITNSRQASRRVQTLIKKFKLADTTITTKIDSNTVTIKVDKVAINDASVDSVVDEIENIIDTVFNDSKDTLVIQNPEVKKKIDIAKKKIRKIVTIENLLKPFVFDSAGVKVNISAKGNLLNIKLELPKKTINKETKQEVVLDCPEITFWQAFKYLGWLIAFLLIIILFLIGLIVVIK
jgi:hypothetical protein